METRGTSLSPWQTVALIVLFWLTYLVTASVRTAVELVPQQLEILGNRTMIAAAGMVLTVPLAIVLHHFRQQSTARLVAIGFAASIPIAIGYAVIIFVVFKIISPLETIVGTSKPYPEPLSAPWRTIVGSAIVWYYFVAAWALLYIALTYAERVRAGERHMAALSSAAQAAELRALRYQINPHFLFNTLNSISALVLSRKLEAAEQMLLNLSEFFRASLGDDPAADVTLADEFEMQRLYLDIEQVRFPNRLSSSLSLPMPLRDVRIPGLILQPIIENAVIHGVARSTSPVIVSLSARAESGVLQIVVEDDAARQPATSSGHGIGLRNVRDRLVARYGSRASLTVMARPNGFRVELFVPTHG